MLGYRTFVNLAGNRADALGLVDEQLYSWAREKGWDADQLIDGETVRLADDAEGTLLRMTTQDGSRTTRFESNEAQGWTMRLTAHVPGSSARQPWLWVDVESPDTGGRPAAPRLVRNLIDVLDVRDGSQSLPAGVVQVGEDDVDSVVARVLDPGRRTIAFLAGSSVGIPLAEWSGYVDKLTRRCSGLASTLVLDPAATSAFAAAMGSRLAVTPWTLRTFMPRVDRDDPNDSVRHRYLSMQRITEDPAPRLAGMLAASATAVIRELPLPREAIRIDRALSKRLDEDIVKRITVVRPEVSTAIASATAHPTHDSPAVVRPAGQDPHPSAGLQPEILDLLRFAITELTGTDTLDSSSVGRLVDLAAQGKQAAVQQTAVRARMDQIQSELDDLTLQILESNELLQEERIQHQLTALDQARADDLVIRLRKKLAQENGDAWADLPASDDDLAPDSFSTLIPRIQTLDYIVFTGDADAAVNLDSHQSSGLWTVKAWEALLALNDYASAKQAGVCETDVDGYLRDLPSGFHGFPVTRFGRDESESVKTNPRFRKVRELPVPFALDPAGVVFMGAHFKLAQSGLISPRLHYHDDVIRSGKIYVGHIGPHLPTKRTN